MTTLVIDNSLGLPDVMRFDSLNEAFDNADLANMMVVDLETNKIYHYDEHSVLRCHDVVIEE